MTVTQHKGCSSSQKMLKGVTSKPTLMQFSGLKRNVGSFEDGATVQYVCVKRADHLLTAETSRATMILNLVAPFQTFLCIIANSSE